MTKSRKTYVYTFFKVQNKVMKIIPSPQNKKVLQPQKKVPDPDRATFNT